MYQTSPVTSFGGMKSMYGIGGVNTIFFLCTTPSVRHTRKILVPSLSRFSRKNPVSYYLLIYYSDFAEDTGFEPVGPFSRLVFETSTINHSDNPPCLRCKINKFRNIYQFAETFIVRCFRISSLVSETAMRNWARIYVSITQKPRIGILRSVNTPVARIVSDITKRT